MYIQSLKIDKRNKLTYTNIHTESEQWQPLTCRIELIYASTQGRNASGSYTLMIIEVEQI